MKNKIILTEKEIIETYPRRNQEFSYNYLRYLELRQKYPSYGYKRLSKLMKEPIHRTRYWHHNGSVPQPICTINWLKERDLLPLSVNNKNLRIMARILGSTFGDGGVFENLNGIFLSSYELEAVKDFGKDLKSIFGDEIESNCRIIRGGEYGSSWCYQNTNRKIIRLFQALGAPIGKKSKVNFKIPKWIFQQEYLMDEFFGALFGSELGTPTIHKNMKNLTSLDIGLVAKDELIPNRIQYFKQVEKYLNLKNVKTTNICISKHKNTEKKLMRLSISKTLDNLANFTKFIELRYCKYKTKRLINTTNQFINLKKQKIANLRTKINHLTKHPFSESWIRKNLRLTEKSYQFVQENNSIEKWQ